MARVTVVGGGIAGIACARRLAGAGVDVEVLDRGFRIGGRMALRETDGHAVDIGASYFTVADAAFAAVVDDWKGRGLARPWTDTFQVSDGRSLTRSTTGPVRWAAAHGLRALVEDLAEGLDVRHPVEVTHVAPAARGGWEVHVQDGPTRVSQAVVLAMPDPQAARILPPDLPASWAPDGAWPWEPVVSVSARYDRRWWPDVDGVFVNADGAGAADEGNVDRDVDLDADRGVDPVVDWIVDDGRRRGDGAPVLVAHSTTGAAARWLDDPAAAVAPVLGAAAAALGCPPPPPPVWTHVQRWGFARPVRPRPAPPFSLDTRGLGVCGDAWGERPRVEAAWVSGTLLGDAVAASLDAAPGAGLD